MKKLILTLSILMMACLAASAQHELPQSFRRSSQYMLGTAAGYNESNHYFTHSLGKGTGFSRASRWRTGESSHRWDVGAIDEQLVILVRDGGNECFLGGITSYDPAVCTCYRSGEGCYRKMDAAGHFVQRVGTWKRDMLHGEVISCEDNGEIVVDTWRYDRKKKGTTRPATAEEQERFRKGMESLREASELMSSPSASL